MSDFGEKMDFLEFEPNKIELFTILTATYCGCLLISNIIAAKTISIYFMILPGSIILFPIVYIMGDILTEIYGFNSARKTIILGLAVNVIAVIAFQIILIIPGTHLEMSKGFEIVFSTTPRILFACFCSYMCGSYINAYVMKVLKEKHSDHLFFRCIISTLFGESADSIIFITICFIGVESLNLILTMIACQVTVKILYEIVVYPLTKRVINWIKSLDDAPYAIHQK